jgi:hypothetical protein
LVAFTLILDQTNWNLDSGSHTVATGPTGSVAVLTK